MMQDPVRPARVALLGALLCVGLAACGPSPIDPPQMVDSGSWYRTGLRWPHDGAPYETEHFIVFRGRSQAAVNAQIAPLLAPPIARSFGSFERRIARPSDAFFLSTSGNSSSSRKRT